MYDFSKDDTPQGPIEPRTIVPSQFFTARERWRALGSTHRLMYAILEDAINVYIGPERTSKQRRAVREARRWLFSDDKSYVFSFLRTCEALDLDPQYIRAGARRRCNLVAGRS